MTTETTPGNVPLTEGLGPAAEAHPLVERLNELPALPTPYVCVRDNDDELVSVWRAFQMRDYARACMRPLLAEIAALAEETRAQVFSLDREAAAEDLHNRLHSLSKAMEGSGRIDEHEFPDAYGTILDAMKYVQMDLGA